MRTMHTLHCRIGAPALVSDVVGYGRDLVSGSGKQDATQIVRCESSQGAGLAPDSSPSRRHCEHA